MNESGLDLPVSQKIVVAGLIGSSPALVLRSSDLVKRKTCEQYQYLP